jgi:uncharacterized protein (UPF0548 family)
LPDALADRLAGLSYNYAEVGATKQDRLPRRFRDLYLETTAGTGTDAFTHLADRLMGWRIHADSGLDIAASRDRAEPGAVLMATYRIVGIPVRSRCRVLYVIDEQHCRGFCYGTLPGHPLRGEERFVVEHRDDDTVVLSVRSFSLPARLLPLLGMPVTQRMQDKINHHYLEAARQS